MFPRRFEAARGVGRAESKALRRQKNYGVTRSIRGAPQVITSLTNDRGGGIINSAAGETYFETSRRAQLPVDRSDRTIRDY